MKSKVLDRPMFKKGMMAVGMAPAEEVDPENVGIMSGFKDMLMGLELPEEEESGMERDDTEKMLNRTPDSPEILMNNLRGDMRSVDARVEELADLVGYPAAADTPESVLALLQPVLAAQQAPATPPGMPPIMPPGMPPAMPPGLPPGMEGAPPAPPGPPAVPPGGIAGLGAGAPPLQMANGGIVQRFRDGSDDEGVSASGNISYPPEFYDLARRRTMEYIMSPPAEVPTLESQVALREPVYRKLLGTGDRDLTAAQMLFDVAGAGLNLASGVDAEGRPLRGAQSPVSRFAAAFSKVPATIGARAAELGKEDRAIRLAAIQAGEKDVANIREQNAKLVESQRKIFSDVLKTAGTSVFGKGDWEWAVVNRPGLLSRWVEGKTNDQENNLIDSAIAEFSTPIYETRSDPVTGQPFTTTRQKTMPSFLVQALIAKGIPIPGPATPTAPGLVTPAPAPGAALQVAPSTAVSAATPSVTYSAKDPTLFNLAGKGTGPINVTKSFLERVPIVGAFVPGEEELRATTYIKNSVNQLNRSLATNPRFAEGERKQIQSELSLLPSLLDREQAYQIRVLSLDDLLLNLRSKAYQQGYNNPNLGPEDIRSGRLKVQDIDEIRNLIGAPPRVENINQFNALPLGSPYVLDGQLKVKTR